MKKQNVNILSFKDCAAQAESLAKLLDVEAKMVSTHHFPDEESLVTIPATVADHVIFYRSLNQPNSKLIELLLAAKTARKHGAKRLSLVAPYLCYMRQDRENHPGEAISQQIIGEMLASLFDDVITVDSHLHRISRLNQVIPIQNAINILASKPISQFIKQKFGSGLIFGPDAESMQWVKHVADKIGFAYAVANKIRSGDRVVKIELDSTNYHNLDVIILDDMASTGRTIGLAANLLAKAGSRSISALVTHALFCGDAKQFISDNHVDHVWSTNSICDDTNIIDLSEIIADAIKSIT